MSGMSSNTQRMRVANLHGLLQEQTATLQVRYGLSDLTILLRDGKYFLDINGQLIEITFLNGRTIPNNLDQLLGQLLEQNGFMPLAENASDNSTGIEDYFGKAHSYLENLFQGDSGFRAFAGASLLGVGVLGLGSSSNSVAVSAPSGPVAQSISTDDVANTVSINYDDELDTFKVPTSDDFEVFVNGQRAGISGISVNDDSVELELAHDLKANDRVSIRYLDQEGDLENSIQGTDGALGGGFLHGAVIDGYIAGAQLYIDKNGDGLPDPDEILEGIATNEKGMFLLDASLNPENLPILVVGGTNIDTGLPNNTILTAPAGSTAITPTTTLIQKMVRDDLVAGENDAEKLEAVLAVVSDALGLSDGIDLLNFDPISGLNNPEAANDAVSLHKFNTSVVEILESFGAATSSNVALAATKIATEIVSSAKQNQELSLNDNFISELVDAVYTTGDNSALKSDLGLIVGGIQSATSLQNIASAQAGVVVTLDPFEVTNSSTPILSGNATNGTKVSVSLGGATYEVMTQDGNWIIDTSNFAPVNGTLDLGEDGAYEVEVSAEERAGTKSALIKQIFVVDTTAPEAPTLSPIENVKNSDFDEGFSVDAGSDVRVAVNGNALTDIEIESKFEVTTAGDMDNYTAKIGAFDGTEIIRVQANRTDVAGNQSNESDVLHMQYVDTKVPSIPLIQAVTNIKNPEYNSGFAVETGAEILIVLGGIPLTEAEIASRFDKDIIEGIDLYTAKPDTFVGSEILTIQAQVTDDAGNQSPKAMLNLRNIDTTAPSAFAIDATLEVDNIVNAAEDDTVSVTGTSTGVEQGQTVNVRSSDGSNHVDVTATVGADGTWTAADADISTLTNGPITVTADVSDAAGNAATQTTKTITLDNVAPSAFASTNAVITTITADGNAQTADLKETDKVVLTIALDETMSNLNGLPTGNNDTIINVADTPVTSDWSTSNNDLQLTYNVTSGVNGAITVDETALTTALTNAGITDAAGNALLVPSFSVNAPTNAIDADDVFFEGLIFTDGSTSIDAEFTESSIPAGIDGSADNTALLVLDVASASEGDTVELHVDNAMVYSNSLDADEISDGIITTTEQTFSDVTNHDVALELKVKAQDGTYIQDNGDVTWEYQW